MLSLNWITISLCSFGYFVLALLLLFMLVLVILSATNAWNCFVFAQIQRLKKFILDLFHEYDTHVETHYIQPAYKLKTVS